MGHLRPGTKLCSSALVFVVEGLCAKWKQPIGSFQFNNATPVEKLRTLVLTSSEKLSDLGLDVHVIVYDQGSTNQQMLKLLRVTAEKPSLMQGKQIMFVHDPPH